MMIASNHSPLGTQPWRSPHIPPEYRPTKNAPKAASQSGFMEKARNLFGKAISPFVASTSTKALSPTHFRGISVRVDATVPGLPPPAQPKGTAQLQGLPPPVPVGHDAVRARRQALSHKLNLHFVYDGTGTPRPTPPRS